jgi:hypothetical protein
VRLTEGESGLFGDHISIVYNFAMPALDQIHNAVKKALIKDDWLITADHYTIGYEDVRVYADLAAEKLLAAERTGYKIAVEIKSFVGRSLLHEFEMAFGQYMLYRDFLSELEPDRKLYLAVSDKTYSDLFALKAIQFIVRRHQIALLVVRLDTEEVVEWIN